MKCEVFTDSYRGFSIRVFWMRPNEPGSLIYGYQAEGDGLLVESTGFVNTKEACRHAGKVIDDFVIEDGVPKHNRRRKRSLKHQGQAMLELTE